VRHLVRWGERGRRGVSKTRRRVGLLASLGARG
jgi:hypothetical protein